jgi:hypothetical protein
MKVDNTSKEFIQKLADEIIDIPYENKSKFAIAMLRQGLIRSPWIFRIMIKLLGEEKFYELLDIVYVHKRELLELFYDDFLNHLLNGKDTYDSTSVGGYSLTELEVIVDTIKVFGWKDV